MKILFSGGGTLGPVTPLLSIHEVIKKAHTEAAFVWVGTKTGPERVLVEKENIEFTTLAGGKFRRYISFWNIIDIFRIIIGFFQVVVFLWKENPDVCISAGGFISVPVHWAAWFLGIPTWIHQQDVVIGLSNKLMAPFAKVITTSLESQTKLFSKKKVHWLGNPVRAEILHGSKEKAKKLFHLKEGLPVVFATGGGTGSLRVNQMIVEAVGHLKGHCQIIHLSGKERPQELVEQAVKHFDYYQVHQFFTEEMKHAYAAADIVISRGGFGTLTELAALKKPAILIPKPGHQVENVKFLEHAGAAILIDERTGTGNYLAKIVKDLLQDTDKQKQMGEQLYAMMPAAKSSDVLGILEKVIED